MDAIVGDQGGSLWFEVLGPLRAYRGIPGGRPPGLAERRNAELALGWPRQRAVLAALVLRAGQVVSRDELIDALWGGDPPATAVNTLHTYITGLRKILEPGRRIREPGRLLASAGSGYVLRLAPGQLDLEATERHIEEARRAKAAGDLRTATDALETAVGFWRGTPLGGVPGPLAEIERARLAELRLVLLEERAEMMLRMGTAADLTGDLASLVAAHPFREGLVGLLMRALHQTGRQAEALAVYQATRRTLAEELGIEPSLSLRRLHTEILSNPDAPEALDEAADPEAPDPEAADRKAVVKLAAVLPRVRQRAMAYFSALTVVLSCVALTSIAMVAVYSPAGPDLAGTTLGDSRTTPPPAALTTLHATGAPRGPQFKRVPPRYVQESCVGPFLPGDVGSARWPPAVIDGNPLTSWRCDGDGAHLPSPQSLTVFFARPVMLAMIGVIGYDPVQPCRFVTSLELIIGIRGYRIQLPASLSPSLRWFAALPVRADRLTLVVTGTTVPRGRTGPNCSRTAMAEVGFAVRR